MGNILVTTPKREHEHALHEGQFVENNPNAFWFRTLRNPKINIGDKVYYVDMGQIMGYGIVFDIEKGKVIP